MRYTKYVLTSLFIFLVVLSGYSQSKDSRPNIVWIVCEDISPFISSYGFNELQTPNIDKLAKEGVRYTHAYTTAGVCAPSRSSIITGMYQSSIGTQHMRTAGDPKYQPVPPYSAVIPEYVKCFPEYLRMAGYYCTNNTKQDYQFEPPVTVWDENSPAASFRNRPKGVPFFSVFNLAITHESMLFSRKDSLLIDPEKLSVPPIYPDTKTVRKDIARLYTNIMLMDKHVGEFIKALIDDGLYDNTIIFFYSDHGGALPWMKRELLERGTHIPLIIRDPKNNNRNVTNDELVSAVDFGPTVLSLANIDIPKHIQGQAFLGTKQSATPRKYIFGARDRMDTEYDRVRMVSDGRYRYLYNYMPEKPYYQEIEYRLNIPMMKEIFQLKDEGKLNDAQKSWFNTKPIEELYDVLNDPYELNNLANDPKHRNKLDELRAVYNNWISSVGDKSSVSEKEMVAQMWNGESEPPKTSDPEIISSKNGVKIKCSTPGASIGFQIKVNKENESVEHEIMTWDFAGVLGGVKNGNKIKSTTSWKVYNGETISLQKGEELIVNAMRIGYKASVIHYKDGKIITE
jgi:arylsulfatase A-like enzyme